MSFKDLTFSWQISIGYVGAKHKDTVKVSDHFTEEEWEEMTNKDREAWLDEYLEAEISNHLDANIRIDE